MYCAPATKAVGSNFITLFEPTALVVGAGTFQFVLEPTALVVRAEIGQ